MDVVFVTSLALSMVPNAVTVFVFPNTSFFSSREHLIFSFGAREDGCRLPFIELKTAFLSLRFSRFFFVAFVVSSKASQFYSLPAHVWGK